MVEIAWRALRPLPSAAIKCRDNVTRNVVGSLPIFAINLETNAERTLDGWETHRQTARPNIKEIPAMPLLITQGHNWHPFLVSQTADSVMCKTIIRQNIDVGNMRTAFDT